MNIYEALREEIKRNEELLKTVTGDTPEAGFKRKSITIELELAEKALKDEDIIKIMRMYRHMRKNK